MSLIPGSEAGVRGGTYLPRHPSQLHLRGTPFSVILAYSTLF